jgi:hypothetical protein
LFASVQGKPDNPFRNVTNLSLMSLNIPLENPSSATAAVAAKSKKQSAAVPIKPPKFMLSQFAPNLARFQMTWNFCIGKSHFLDMVKCTNLQILRLDCFEFVFFHFCFCVRRADFLSFREALLAPN